MFNFCYQYDAIIGIISISAANIVIGIYMDLSANVGIGMHGHDEYLKGYPYPYEGII